MLKSDEEAETTLNDIVDMSSRSMPRARAHVVDLMESFLTTQQAIKDLEQQIEEVRRDSPV